MGVFGVIGPCTCPHCDVDQTVWCAITCNGQTAETLTAEWKATIARILAEPSSIQAL